MLCVHLPAFTPKGVHLLVIFNWIWGKGSLKHKQLPLCFLEIMENREGASNKRLVMLLDIKYFIKKQKEKFDFYTNHAEKTPKPAGCQALLVWIIGTLVQ